MYRSFFFLTLLMLLPSWGCKLTDTSGLSGRQAKVSTTNVATGLRPEHAKVFGGAAFVKYSSQDIIAYGTTLEDLEFIRVRRADKRSSNPLFAESTGGRSWLGTPIHNPYKQSSYSGQIQTMDFSADGRMLAVGTSYGLLLFEFLIDQDQINLCLNPVPALANVGVRSVFFADYEMYQSPQAAKSHTLIYQTTDNALGFLRPELRYKANANDTTSLSQRCSQNIGRHLLAQKDSTYVAGLPFVFAAQKYKFIRTAILEPKKLTGVAGPFQDKVPSGYDLHYNPNLGRFTKNIYIFSYGNDHRLMYEFPGQRAAQNRKIIAPGLPAIQNIFSFPSGKTVTQYRNAITFGEFPGWGSRYDYSDGLAHIHHDNNFEMAAKEKLEKLVELNSKRKMSRLQRGLDQTIIAPLRNEARVAVRKSFDAPVNRTTVLLYEKGLLQMFSAPQGAGIAFRERDYFIEGNKQILDVMQNAKDVFVADRDRFFVLRPDGHLVCVDLAGRSCGV
jgi:hypothetical protein